jgi:hypothetical protein
MSCIAFFHPSPDWDGLARVYLEIGRALSARGITVGIVCPAASPVAAACTALDLLPFEMHGSLFADSNRLSQLLRQYGCEALMVAGENEHLLAALAVRRSGRGAVLRRIRTGASSDLTIRTRLAVRLAPTWFVHTSGAEAQASEPLGKLRGRVVADLAIDPAQFDRITGAPTPIGTSTIALVTDPGAIRATAAALRSIAAMRQRGHPIHTLLIGTLHDASEVRVHATSLGFGDAIAFLGDPLDRAPLLAAADLVWVVAERDDGGIAVLDAMALGVPVLVTRGTMAERYVQPGETGIVTERDDALATAALITLLRADTALLSRLSEQALAGIRSRRALSAVADTIAAVLQQAGVAQVAA